MRNYLFSKKIFSFFKKNFPLSIFLYSSSFVTQQSSNKFGSAFATPSVLHIARFLLHIFFVSQQGAMRHLTLMPKGLILSYSFASLCGNIALRSAKS